MHENNKSSDMNKKETKSNEKPSNANPMEASFDYWQQTAAYAIKQYKLAMKWATKESSQEWVKQYNKMWSKTYRIYGEEFMPQYPRAWQNMWEEFSIDSFNKFNEYWKKIMIEYSEGRTSNAHYETREKLANDWISSWLKS